MRMTTLAALATAMMSAGCAADSSVLHGIVVMPSAYDPLSCPELVAKFRAADTREKELAALMEKSGSPIANAIAYDSEYTAAHANRKYAEEAAARKGCELKKAEDAGRQAEDKKPGRKAEDKKH